VIITYAGSSHYVGVPELVLRGRYRLDVLIATGGMGEVWRGTDLAIDRRVAIKVLRPEHEDDEEGLVRFRAEAHHAGSLSHPNIAQVFDYGEPVPPEPGYLVMELVEGLSLTRILDDGPLPPEDVMDIVAQSARGLAAAHRTGLVHRDIKPGNLLLRSDGLVKITDFGIAHADGQTTFTQPGMLIGTPAYLAPERVSGGPATPAGDLYALGVVAHQCLTGHVPFAGEALAVALAHLDRGLPALPPSVPPGVAALVTYLTRKDPAARPPSAWDVALRAEHLRVLLSSPEALSRHGTAAAPLAVPGAEGAVLAGAALAGAGPDPARAEAPADRTQTPPRGGRPRSRGSRRAPGRTSLPARGALAATGLAAIGFIAWTLATLPGQAGANSPAVAPPAATRSSTPSVLPRQSPLAATGNAGTSGGKGVVAQAAATPQPSSSSTRPAPSSPAAPTPTPRTPPPTPATSPTPTLTPTTPPTSPAPTSPAPSTSTPAPTTSGGSLTSSTVPLPSADASAISGLILASRPIVP
jgi:serine/threonine protein kinase